jgi:leader peptidase (prepilin peptidase)/N-methyltransferase
MWHLFESEPYWAIAVAVGFGLGMGRLLSLVAHHLPQRMEREWLLQLHAYHTQGSGGLSDMLVPSPQLCRPTWHSPYTECVTALLFGLCVWRFGFSLLAFYAMGLCAALVVLAWIDIQTKLLPDVITLPLMWVGLLVNLNHTLVPLTSAVLGVVAGYVFLWVLFHFFRFLTGQDGMGHGDFKLFAALGAWLGVASLPIILFVSTLAGLVGMFFLQLTGRAQRGEAFAFGPYLALAGIAVLFFPTEWLDNSF